MPRKDRECPICNGLYPNLWGHFWNDHKDSGLSESEFLVKYLNLSSVPKCSRDGCDNDCQILFRKYRFSNYCSRSCISKINIHKRIAYRYNHPSNTMLARLDFQENPRYCVDCHKLLSFMNRSGYCSSCTKRHRSEVTRKKLSDAKLNLVKLGRHKGWNSRNIKSYAERFWESVLNNNKISYKREVKVGKYFLDFVIGNIDLEIDGKQHKYEDRHKSDLIRDEYLRKVGYFVYRISWNDIKTESGKDLMKNKIDLFLDFLDGSHSDEF